MVLEILADTPYLLLNLDPVAPELLALADPGNHHDLRRPDRAGREDHFARGVQLDCSGGGLRREANRAAFRKPEPFNLRIREDFQVRPLFGLSEIGNGGAAATALQRGLLEHAHPFLIA